MDLLGGVTGHETTQNPCHDGSGTPQKIKMERNPSFLKLSQLWKHPMEQTPQFKNGKFKLVIEEHPDFCTPRKEKVEPTGAIH